MTRRPAWDEVRTNIARGRQTAEAAHAAALASTPSRPMNTWLVSGERIDPAPWVETECTVCHARLIPAYPGQTMHPDPCDPDPPTWTAEQLAAWCPA